MPLEGLVDRLAGGSIGLAGPRGSGKSTLVRGYCDGARFGSGDLRCMVAAPVDYVARDFALHLFATFCRSVRAQLGRWSGPFDDLLVAYLYLCATLQEIFGQHVEESRLLWATADGDRHPGHVDMLATARLGLGHSARVAWRLVGDLRDAWSPARLEET